MLAANNDWKTVDGHLRDIASRRAALDAEEARWLREAERLRIWRELGMVSALDYMERILGYAPHAAMERLRVARALESLPLLEGALDAGDLCFSAVRELSRVATPGTESAWRDRALGKNLRQIEELVAGHAHGDLPDDPRDPSLEPQLFKLLVSPDVLARVEPTGRAKFQILMTVCEQCKQGHQAGAGVQIAVDAAAVERAFCDAQHIGSTSDATPARATQDIPPSVRRFVWHRDGGRCQTPGCRSARGLEVHHVVHRADGGTHDPSNLRLACSACHQATHRGTLVVEGHKVQRPNAPAPSHVGSRLDETIVRTQARDALVRLGWKPNIARTAVDEAMSHVGFASLEGLIREALRRCPRPAG